MSTNPDPSYGNHTARIIKSACESLVEKPGYGLDVDFHNYTYLHQEGRNLIRAWFLRAMEAQDCRPAESFEPFIYLWIAFNAWASCVSGFDRDFIWMQALSVNADINEEFSSFVSDYQSTISRYAWNFYELWPIFRASEIRKKNAQKYGAFSRQELTEYFFSVGIDKYQPRCLVDHRERREAIPLDWQHTLFVLYQVRCNLFHGEKAIHSENDQRIVYDAYKLMLNYISDSQFICL